ncbi:MAG TPA: DUF2147 domain-containing protein [Devosiaceae bacterium]
MFKRLLNGFAVAALLLGTLATPLLAADLAPSPVGKWQVTTGESRFQVTTCGDGTELCAKLVWLRKDMRTAENLKYLNTYVLKGALPVDANKWRGTVQYQGQTVGGSLTLVDNDRMVLTGCQLVICQRIDFTRL